MIDYINIINIVQYYYLIKGMQNEINEKKL